MYITVFKVFSYADALLRFRRPLLTRVEYYYFGWMLFFGASKPRKLIIINDKEWKSQDTF